MVSAREYWLSFYWVFSGDREDCALNGWSHLNPLNPDRQRILGVSRAKLSTWRLTRRMRDWRIMASKTMPAVIPRTVPFRRRGFLGLVRSE